MPGIVFKATTYSSSKVEYTIELYDRYLSTTENHTVTASMAPQITWDNDRKLDPWSLILFSKCEWTFMINDQDDEDLIDDLIQGDEDQYYLRLYKDGSLYWVGMVLIDQVIKPRDSFPYPITLSATDGLKRLDTIRIEQVASSQDNLVQFMRDILVRTGINNALSASADFLSVAVRYYENQHGSYAKTFDPLRYTRVYQAQRLSVRSEDDGRKEYFSQMEMLRWLLKGFGCRLMMINGHYHAMQVDAYSESNIRLHTYSQNINFDTDTSIIAGTASSAAFVHAKAIAQNKQILQGDHWSFAPPVRRVSLRRDLGTGFTIQPRGLFNGLDADTAFGAVVQGSFNSGLMIDFSVVGVNWTNASAPANFRVEFGIMVRINATGTDYYLSNANGNLVWSTSSTATYNVTVNATAPPAGAGSSWFTNLPVNNALGTYFIGTPPLPTSGNLIIKITPTFRSLTGTDITSNFTDTSVDGGVFISYNNYDAQKAPEEGISYVFGDETASSYVIDLDDIYIADNPNTSDAGKLEVYDGSRWDEASTWKRFESGSDANRLLLLVIETIYKLQQRALHILNATVIRSDITPLNTITVDDKKMLFQGGTFNTELDEWQGQWIEIAEYSNSGAGAGFEGIEISTNGPGLPYLPAGEPFGKTERTIEGSLVVATTDAVISGTVTSVSINAPGVNVANIDDKLAIFNPLTGESEELTLSAALLNDSTSASVDSVALNNEYPVGSYLIVPLKNLLSRVYALENP